MSEQSVDPADSGTLAAVRRLEQALGAHSGAHELAAARLATARGEASSILAAARAAGTEEGLRRVAALEPTAEVEAISAAGQAHLQGLRERVLAERDDLVAELVAIVTAQGT